MQYWDETRELNESSRANAEGSFVALENGITHYELGGNSNGACVVLIHGFSVPYFIFDPTFEYLCQAGFRVLRYDLFGRGLSDRPNLNYDMHLFVHQLKNLLDVLGFGKAHLIALSMGGPISASFIREYPEYVLSHTLIDPAGARPLRFSRLLKLGAIPFLGEIILAIFGTEGMVKNIASDLFTPELVVHFQERYRVQMQFRGFKRAILSTIRNGMLDSFENVYESIGKLEIRTLLFWGRQDATIPFEQSRDMMRAIPHVQLQVIENCGHVPHYEKPEEVHPILLEFLKREIHE